MKRAMIFLLLTIFSLSLLTSCKPQAANTLSYSDIHYDFSDWDFLTTDNEIVSYERLDTDKIPLVIGVAGNTLAQPLIMSFAQQHPECQVVVIEITSGDNDEALVDALDNGRIPDVLFTDTNKSTLNRAEQYFTDLSDKPICQNYYTSALQQFDVNGRLYHLPGPSSSFGIIYNKTLFADHGWEVPKTFDAFLGLCQQIETETGKTIDAFNPNAKYAIWLSDLLLTPSYTELLQGPKNYRWLQKFQRGEATFTGHMEPFFENVLALADAGALTDEDWKQSATTLHSDFMAGNIAMIDNTWDSSFLENPQFEFDMFPIPGKNEGEDFIISVPSYAIAVPKSIQPRSPEKQALIDALLEFASTGESQSLLLNGTGLVPSVMDLPLKHEGGMFPLMHSALEYGRVYPRQSFSFGGANINTLKLISEQAQSLLRGEQTVEGACTVIDEYTASYFSGQLESVPPELVGQADENFTILETTQLLCDIFREKTQADVAIVMQGATYRGNLMPIYAGELNTRDITNLKPRSLQGDSSLVKLEMTGAELLECLNHPYNALSDSDNHVVYAFSGLWGTVRPLAPLGEKYVTLTLADGKVLEPDRIYTVATWEGMVWEQYEKNIAASYPGTFQEIFTEYLIAHTPISPADDERMTLLWD